MRWGEAMTLEFVKMYLNHECLWNPSHPGYKLKHQREQAYTKIVGEFKEASNKTLTVTEIKVKIKNLRTTYAQQVHKILKKSSPNSIYQPSLVWFHEMDKCLKNIPTYRHAPFYSSVQETPEVGSSCHNIWVDQNIQDGEEETNPDPLIPQQSDDEYETRLEEFTKIKKERQLSPEPYKKNKKKKRKHKSMVPDDSSDFSEVLQREDEFDIYGKFIAAQLRKMDLQKALRLQLEIQTLVSEARMSDISS